MHWFKQLPTKVKDVCHIAHLSMRIPIPINHSAGNHNIITETVLSH